MSGDQSAAFDVVCDKHKRHCVLKTGMNVGPNYLKSFYICPSDIDETCNFVQKTSLKPVKCPEHDDQFVELQARIHSRSQQCSRFYYRCKTGHNEKMSWCGFTLAPLSNAQDAAVSSDDETAPATLHDHSKPVRQTLAEIRPNSTETKGDKDYRTVKCVSRAGVDDTRSSEDKQKRKEIAAVSSIDRPHGKSCGKEKDDMETSLIFSDSANGKTSGSGGNGECAMVGHMNMSVDDCFDGESCDSGAGCGLVGSDISSHAVLKSSDERLGIKSDDASVKSKKDAQKDAIRREDSGFNSAVSVVKSSSLSKPSSSKLAVNVTESRPAAKIGPTSFGELAKAAVGKSAGKNPASPSVSDSFTYRDKSVLAISDDDTDDDDDFQKPKTSAKTQEKNKILSSGSVTSKNSGDLETISAPRHTQSNNPQRTDVAGLTKVLAVNQPALIGVPAVNEAKNVVVEGQPSRPASDDRQSVKTDQLQPSTVIKVIRVNKDGVGVGSSSSSGGATGGGGTGGGTVLAGGSASAGGRISVERENLQKLIDEKKALLRKVDISKLPDGGAKIRGQIESMTQDLRRLDIQPKDARPTVSAPVLAPFKPPASASSLSNSKPTIAASFSQWKPSGGSTVDSGFTSTQSTSLKQTKLIGFAPISANALQQMHAAQQQQQQHLLYGGRMTATRLHEVNAVTTEAIEQLYKQFETCPDAEKETSDPEGIVVPLMLHQRQALTWLVWREHQRPPGGILADDMGLGKTLTMIALIMSQKAAETADGVDKSKDAAWLSRSGQALKSRATLVVCPASLVHQWNNEIERRVHPGLLDVIVYHGPNRDCSVERLSAADVVLTTYNIVSREVEIPEHIKNNKQAVNMPATDLDDGADSSVLTRIHWRRVVIDEAHCIKNHKSQTAMTTCRLKADCRWALTGTPIQNNLLDMYALLRFLRCSPFDELKVWKRQVDNKTNQGIQRLNTLIKSLLLRRTKDQTNATTGKPLVALPAKHVVSHELQLSADERQVYDKLFKESQNSVQEYLRIHEEKMRQEGGGSKNVAALNPWAGDDFYRPPPSSTQTGVAAGAPGQRPPALIMKSVPRGGQILIYLLRLRQCCSHLGIMKGAIDVDALQAEGLDLDVVEQMKDLAIQPEELSTDVNGRGPTNDSIKDAFDTASQSTKIKELIKMLVKIRAESSSDLPVKCVVVSQWVSMLDIVEQHLTRERFRCCAIKGNVPVKQRSQIVDAFNMDSHGPTVMLVSLRAGGVGLNLIGGSHLFLIDMHWNPALEQQACDRIYRVGQKRDVFIHRFVCKDTIEEKILALQRKKTELASNVLTGAASTVEKLTLDDLKMLFGLDKPPAFFPSSSVSMSMKHF